jgi:ABC-type nitrate/sulfonate/bicarbonate transport system substrate-binding protein
MSYPKVVFQTLGRFAEMGARKIEVVERDSSAPAREELIGLGGIVLEEH